MASLQFCLFQRFVLLLCIASLSRTAVADAAGSESQFYGTLRDKIVVILALIFFRLGVINGVLCLLFGFMMPLLKHLPNAV
jgi:hypothetical protein